MTQQHPKVSVVLPVYNGENYLQEAIDSVLVQTFEDFELVVIDNASTDGTASIIQKYVHDERICSYRNNHTVSMGANFNISLLQARGQYIKILSHDDVLKPTYLEDFVSILDSRPSVVLVTSFDEVIGAHSFVKGAESFPAVEELEGKWAIKSLLGGRNWIGGPSATMFRRNALQAGLFNISFAGALDWEFWLRVLSMGNLYVISEPLFSTRKHSEQATRQCRIDLTFDKERLRILDLVSKFPEVYGEFTEKEKKIFLDKAIKSFVGGTINRSIAERTPFILLKNYNYISKNVRGARVLFLKHVVPESIRILMRTRSSA